MYNKTGAHYADNHLYTFRVDKTSGNELETTLISQYKKVAGQYSGPNLTDVEKWHSDPSFYTYKEGYEKTEWRGGFRVSKEGSTQELFTISQDEKQIFEARTGHRFNLQK